eukprot:m.137374 g.137374  ORF g.137374 m.137374 type:complete len:194 (-) comp11626_c0_seq1:200-781(-)
MTSKSSSSSTSTSPPSSVSSSATKVSQPPFLYTLDSIGIKTANISGTLQFCQEILGLDRKFQSNIYFGSDPALAVCPGNNSGLQLCPSSSRGLSFISFRVSEMGFEHAKLFLKEKKMKFREQSKDVCKSLVFQDPVNGYELMLTCWPKSQSHHASKQVSRKTLRKAYFLSFFLGVSVGISASAVAAFFVIRKL